MRGTLHAFDIEGEMIEATRARANAAGADNVRFHHRDFMAQGTGLPDASVDYVMVFNILHAEHPVQLLREAWRILRPGGKAGIMHWRYDPTTPRGPSMEIRPRPEQCREWAKAAGFSIAVSHIDLPDPGAVARAPGDGPPRRHAARFGADGPA